MRACLLLSAVVVLALPVAERAAAEPVRLALLPIAVHSAEPDAAYVSSGLAAMLSARLERSGRISVIRVPGEAGAADELAAVQAARDSGAEFVLFGSFTQFGEGASLDLRCAPLGAGQAAAGAPRQIFIHSGSIGEIIPRMDELSEKVTRYVETGMAPAAGVSGNGAAGDDAGALQELQRRVEALERAVYPVGQGAAAPEGAER